MSIHHLRRQRQTPTSNIDITLYLSINTLNARAAHICSPKLTQQNIRVIAQYYTRITLPRLTELLDLSASATEKTICKLVTDKTIYARIDRPRGIVTFKRTANVSDTLNAWSGDLSKMLGLVEKTSHLVSKEYAMHEAGKKEGKRGVKA